MITKIFKLLLIVLISIIGFFGCDQKFDNVIDSFNNDYQVVSVSPSDSIYYNFADSLVTISVKFKPASTIQTVFCDVYASDNSKLSSLTLNDQGKDIDSNQVYSNKIPLSTYYPNGTYNVKYFITDGSNTTKEVAVTSFIFDNGQNNVAPVISNDIVEPDTAIVTSTTIIQTSIKVFDQNGLSDIEKVYFVVYRPDGSTNNIQNTMYDDGNIPVHGDQKDKDGIYSLIIEISSSNTKGTYRLEFQARDRGGKLSNIINHSLLIQ